MTNYTQTVVSEALTKAQAALNDLASTQTTNQGLPEGISDTARECIALFTAIAALGASVDASEVAAFKESATRIASMCDQIGGVMTDLITKGQQILSVAQASVPQQQ